MIKATERKDQEMNQTKTIRISSECKQCLRRLIENTVAAASPSPELRQKAVEQAWNLVERMQDDITSPAHLANCFHPVIKSVCQNPDPFADQKQMEMRAASNLAESYRPSEEASFREWLMFAAMGNVIDFFRPAHELEQWMEQPVHFGLDRIDSLERKLETGRKTILWLADNAGEVFFDLPFLKKLTQEGHEVFYAVKGGPIQNDLTSKDLLGWSLDTSFLQLVDTGAATVGLEMDRVSESFRELYHAVDLIIAKGMGHFETLAGVKDPRLFFLLMAKCHPVARALGVPLNHFVAFFVNESEDLNKNLTRKNGERDSAD